MRPLLLVLVLSLIAAACAGGGGADAGARLLPAEFEVDDEAFLTDLRDGGLTLLIRHAATTGPGVDPLDSLSDCTRQRELSDAGREDARGMGAAIEALGIPIGTVLASPFCRTVESAELAFGRHVVDEDLLSLASLPEDERSAAAARAAARYAAVPEAGTTTVLLGQRSNISAVTGASPGEGATVVLEPDGEAFAVMGVLPEGFWQAFAAAYAD